MDQKEKFSLTNIIIIIGEIRETVTKFGNSFFSFENDSDYQKSVAFSLTQVGEIIRHNLSGELKEKYADISWDLYRLFRNDLVHAYNTIDLKEIWYFVQNDLKPLEEYVRYILIEEQVN